MVGELGAGGRAETLALGETPNVAARVQAIAAPNTVLITSATQRLVAGLFIIEEHGAHSLKGVREPVVLYRVLQPSGVRSRFDVARAHGFTPFVGREDERLLLCKRWEQARAGEGQVVLISGEAGIGKSRLVQQLKEHLADDPHTWLECGASPYHQNTPFYAVVDLLQQVLAWRGDESVDERITRLEQGLTLAGVPLTEAVPLMAPLLSLPVPARYPPPFLSPEAQRRRTFTTLAAWLCGAAQLQPVVAVLDLHWADPSTLELQALLVEQGATAPLLLVYTARPEFRAPWPLLGHHAQLTLNRLGRPEIRKMIRSMASLDTRPEKMGATRDERFLDSTSSLSPFAPSSGPLPGPRIEGCSALPDDVIETVITRTDGVPLFIEELTKAVIESQGSASARMIPTTLEDSLRARLDRLGPAKEVAQLGAVVGREFSYALVHAVSPLSEVDLQSALTRLVDAELLYARGQPPAAHYVFKHALVQDAAYASLLKTRRRALHRAIAAALVAAFPETVETQPELLAHHYTEAGATEPAVAAWQRAGERATARSAHAEALGHVRHALALLSTLPESTDRHTREIALQFALGSSMLDSVGFGYMEIETAMERTRVLCEAVGDRSQLGSALGGLAQFYMNAGSLDRGIALAEQSLEIAQQTGAGTLLWVAHYLLGMAEHDQGKFALSLERLQRALATYGSAPHDSPAWARGLELRTSMGFFCAWNLWALGYPDRALQHAKEAVAVARTLAHPLPLGLNLFCETVVHGWRGDATSMRELAEQLIAHCEVQGFQVLLGDGKVVHGAALVASGTGAPALAEVWEGFALGAPPGPHQLALLATVQHATGQHAQALATLDNARAICAHTGARCWDAELNRLKGEIVLVDSQQSRAESEKIAEDCFRRALEIARGQDAKSLELRAATSLARLLRTQGKPDEPRALLAPIYNWFTEGFDTKDLQDAKRLIDDLS